MKLNKETKPKQTVITVFDINTCTTYIYIANYSIMSNADAEEFIKTKNHKPSECNYMLSDNINIEIESDDIDIFDDSKTNVYVSVRDDIYTTAKEVWTSITDKILTIKFK